MTGSIGEGMVDIGSNPTGDYRVVTIKRAAANLIDMIEQMEVQPTDKDGETLRQQAMQLVSDACDRAVRAANMRTPVKTIPPEPDQPGSKEYDAAVRKAEGEEIEGAPV